MKNFKLVNDDSLVDSVNKYLQELKSLTVSINVLNPTQTKLSNENSKRINDYILSTAEITNIKKTEP